MFEDNNLCHFKLNKDDKSFVFVQSKGCIPSTFKNANQTENHIEFKGFNGNSD
jgi:hypothetical protein